MAAYGFADWEGNDRHFMGWAGTGVHFDPIIAANAASWLRANAVGATAAVVPHRRAGEPARRDVVPDRPARLRPAATPMRCVAPARFSSGRSGKTTTSCRCSTRATTRCATTLPPNFGDDLLDKPAAQRQWRWDQQHGLWGYIDPSDTKSWLRHLDYYVKLQRMADESLGTVLGALEESGAYDDTDRHLHLRSRRHVRLARAAFKGPVRLRRDHARAVLHHARRASTQAGYTVGRARDPCRSRVDDLSRWVASTRIRSRR